ncbi:MAG: GNAT family N-acetyltransferase [Chloroflexota bacterium]
MAVTIRPFTPQDYERLSEVGAAVDPTHEAGVELTRHRDEHLEPRVRSLRLVAQTGDGTAVGFGRIMHIWWNFHPRRFVMRIVVDPPAQGRGAGSTLYSTLLAELQTWDPELVRGDARADDDAARAFVEHRGFRELRQRWQSVLDVASANTAALTSASERAERSGIQIVTFAEESRTVTTDALLRKTYDADADISGDEPGMDAGAEMMPFETFVHSEIAIPNALPDANFLAKDGDRIVGTSRLVRDMTDPTALHQAFTGVRAAYRGRGIAQALKLRTVEYAREHGFRAIQTTNDSVNAPMLHINAAIGFVQQVPSVIFERRFADEQAG